MICHRVFLMILASLVLPAVCFSAAPEVSNVQVQQRPGTFLVDITFDLFDADGDLMDVIVMFSEDGGQTWPVRCDSLSGDYYNQESGTGKTITWEPRGQFPEYQGDNCRLRLFASDNLQHPRLAFFRELDGGHIPLTPGSPDTVGFGQPYHLSWAGIAPIVEGIPLDILAEMDTVYPFDDGTLGFKWRVLPDNCIPALEDCWHPRWFNEATGDSFSYFGSTTNFYFTNDNSGTDPWHRLLESGEQEILINSVDIVQNEVLESQQRISFVVNYDPETILLANEMDAAHPEDPQVYPYYTLLNDPLQTRYPFAPGDTIPDRTYVVFKALFRDDPRDLRLDPDYMASTGHFQGVRHNLTGGLFGFQSQASPLDEEPDWGPGADGWYADTLGFMPAPHCDFAFFMRGVDEHGRRDGTPASFAFSVGHAPCLQCVEILPDYDDPSAWDADLACYEPGDSSHPCFDGPTTFYVHSAASAPQPGRTYLQQEGLTYLAIDKATHWAEFMDTEPQAELYYSFLCHTYTLGLLLHGQDDAREAWDNLAWRSLAWKYQVDYTCDPWNSIQDGGGLDDILQPTWGWEYGQDQIEILPQSGVWKMGVKVAIPELLVNLGGPTFYQIILYTMADGDPDLADELYGISIRQLGAGTVRAIALDQTQCGYQPLARPARYHVFNSVRPPVSHPGQATWRDCFPLWPEVDYSLSLGQNAMQSSGGEPATQLFEIIFQDVDGSDLVCDESTAEALPAQLPWQENVRRE